MKSAVRDQMRGRKGKAKVRQTLNRKARRQSKMFGTEPSTRRTLDRVLL